MCTTYGTSRVGGRVAPARRDRHYGQQPGCWAIGGPRLAARENIYVRPEVKHSVRNRGREEMYFRRTDGLDSLIALLECAVQVGLTGRLR